MSKRSTTQVQLIMWGAIVLYGMFAAGVSFADRHFLNGGFNLLFACIFGFLFELTLRERDDLVREKLADEAKKKLDKIFAEAEKATADMLKKVTEVLPSMVGAKDSDAPSLDHDDMLMEVLGSIMAKVVGDSMPTTEQLEHVTRRFNEQTGHHVKLHPEEGGFAAEFSHAAFSPMTVKDDGTAVPARRSRTTVKEVPARTKRTVSAAQKERNNAARRMKRRVNAVPPITNVDRHGKKPKAASKASKKK